MAQVLLPPVMAALVWWASTGALFWRMGKPRGTYAVTVLTATLAMIAGTLALISLRSDTGMLAAYGGFLAGIAIWAWHEALFLTGYVAGPRRDPCPEGLSTWHRFLASTKVVIHHELAIAAHAALLIALSWGAANQIAAWTFLLLWGMRLNAKLVVFLGAPNISDEFLPKHLTYLSTYFGKRRVTAFFPIFITLATATATALTYAAFLQPTGTGLGTGLILISALAWLAVLEHWALVLPIPDGALWRWAQPNTSQSSQLDNNQKIGGSNGL